jgi:putative acyl-CoA dehydrogenase
MIKDFDFDKSNNQPPILENYNLFTSDLPLQTAVEANGGAWNNENAAEFGELLGRAETLELGNLANKNAPVLKTHDRFGNRLDLVEFHPAYHELMRISIENETHSLAWTSQNPGKYVARSVLAFLKQQTDEGTSCPLTMTFAVVPSLKIEPKIAAEWLPKVLSNEYDARFLPASEKRGATFGMAMTEPQGGSDVRANTTFAEKLNDAGEYAITGRKWFCSAPMSDAFLVLAQTAKGLSCFLMPRFKPSGEKNALYFQRLKDQEKSNFTRRTAESSAKKGAAWRILWKWCATPGSIARSVLPELYDARSPKAFIIAHIERRLVNY